MAQSTCGVVEDDVRCTKPGRLKRGMCPMHYRRWSLYGDPTVRKNRGPGELRALLYQAITTETDECIILPPKAGRPTAEVNGQGMNASRAVWTLKHGDPGDAWVLHTCHRGADGCINLRHLYLGDASRNALDTHEAGRHRADHAGERNGRAKLTQAEADEIRRRYQAGGIRQDELAAEYGVSQVVISSITRGERWTPEGTPRRTVADRRRRPSAEVKAAILARWQAGGVSQQALADEFGVGQTTVSRIVRSAG